MFGGPAKCHDTRQSARATLPGRVMATRSGTSTIWPADSAGSVSRVLPHHAYWRTGGSALAAAEVLAALDAAGLPSADAVGGEGAQVGMPRGEACPSGWRPTSMHTAAAAAMVLRSSSDTGTTHRGEAPKSCTRLAGPRSWASMGGAVCSLQANGR